MTRSVLTAHKNFSVLFLECYESSSCRNDCNHGCSNNGLTAALGLFGIGSNLIGLSLGRGGLGLVLTGIYDYGRSGEGRNPQALLTVDNRSVNLNAGEKLTITKGEFPIKSISINNNFIAALNQKLLWGEDKRNMQ